MAKNNNEGWTTVQPSKWWLYFITFLSASSLRVLHLPACDSWLRRTQCSRRHVHDITDFLVIPVQLFWQQHQYLVRCRQVSVVLFQMYNKRQVHRTVVFHHVFKVTPLPRDVTRNQPSGHLRGRGGLQKDVVLPWGIGWETRWKRTSSACTLYHLCLLPDE